MMHSRKSIDKENNYTFSENDEFIRTLKYECQESGRLVWIDRLSLKLAIEKFGPLIPDKAFVENYYLAQYDRNVGSKTLFIRYEDLALNVMERFS